MERPVFDCALRDVFEEVVAVGVFEHLLLGGGRQKGEFEVVVLVGRVTLFENSAENFGTAGRVDVRAERRALSQV